MYDNEQKYFGTNKIYKIFSRFLAWIWWQSDNRADKTKYNIYFADMLEQNVTYKLNGGFGVVW